MFLHRESYYDETSEDTNTAEVIVRQAEKRPAGYHNSTG